MIQADVSVRRRSAEYLLLPLQKKQAEHDERAHRDILALDTQSRVKHMVLHFLKYIGRVVDAQRSNDLPVLQKTLVDTLIISFATANALNVSIGEHLEDAADIADLSAKRSNLLPDEADLFTLTLRLLASPAGRMAKAVESSDHWEAGNHRADLERLIVEFTALVIGLLHRASVRNISGSVAERWDAVESRNIFRRLGGSGS